MRDHQDQADDEGLAIATIEHVKAIQNIEEVVSTLGLDLTFIAPGDLATSMGHHGQADHPVDSDRDAREGNSTQPGAADERCGTDGGVQSEGSARR